MEERELVMKYCGSLYVVDSKEKTLKFYKELFGLRMVQDFGTNFTIKGGISFQTRDSWRGFIHKDLKDIIYGGNDAEIYMETEDLDAFVQLLDQHKEVQIVHPLQTHDWGQRGIRVYDPDMHIIEVAETMPSFCKRFEKEGLSIKEISDRTGLSEKMVQQFLHK